MTQDNKKYLLKCLVGSQAHGLADANSDSDYRGVYVLPTREILSLGYNYKGSHWLEGEQDQTAYEIGHFLQLATKCNPTILECFVAPVHYDLTYNTSLGYYLRLQGLFKCVWTPKDAFNAFVGYGLNQRKKMLDNHLDRWPKYATAYLRTLHNLNDLLRTGTFSLVVPEGKFKENLLSIRNETHKWKPGQIVDWAEDLVADAKIELEKHEKGVAAFKQEQNIEKVNEFLLEVRHDFWE